LAGSAGGEHRAERTCITEILDFGATFVVASQARLEQSSLGDACLSLL
jgi:hypothetical protein